MMRKPPASELRTAAQLREHYETERDLADRLRRSPREERRALYSSLYDEMFRRVPHHPQLARKSSPEQRLRDVAEQISYLRPFLKADAVFLEIGPGDCALSFEVAGYVKQVYGVDVSEELARRESSPPNFRLIISDGCSIPLPPESVRVAYSNQLMEHLHPDDALEQLRNICRVLARGGVYLCNTPNRLSGPHDISRYFDPVATGFHLREYTVSDLSRLFKSVGFSRLRVYAGIRGKYLSLPAGPVILCEKLLGLLPGKLRAACAGRLPFRALLGIQLIGRK